MMLNSLVNGLSFEGTKFKRKQQNFLEITTLYWIYC
jgi:hypothetical protein